MTGTYPPGTSAPPRFRDSALLCAAASHIRQQSLYVLGNWRSKRWCLTETLLPSPAVLRTRVRLPRQPALREVDRMALNRCYIGP